jgi:hypothetical protein
MTVIYRYRLTLEKVFGRVLAAAGLYDIHRVNHNRAGMRQWRLTYFKNLILFMLCIYGAPFIMVFYAIKYGRVI